MTVAYRSQLELLFAGCLGSIRAWKEISQSFSRAAPRDVFLDRPCPDLPDLYGVDRWSFGEDRSALIRATLNLHPGWGLITRDASGLINGYLVRSAYYESTVRIGPLMASSLDVARVLLAHALQTDGGRSVEVSVPGSVESPAHGVLLEFGFVGCRDRHRMELGEAPRPGGLEAYGTTPYLAT